MINSSLQHTKYFLILIAALLALSVVTVWGQSLEPSPVPPSPPAPTPVPPAIPSDIRMPVSALAPDLSKVEEEACEFYKGSDSVPIVGDFKFEVWRKKPLHELKLSGNSFSMSAQAYYFVDVGLLAQCGWDDEAAKEVEVGIDSKLKWGRNWNLESHTAVRPFRCPVPDPNDPRCRCRLTRWDIDITDRLFSHSKNLLQNAASKFDRMLAAQSNYRRRANQVWLDLQKPINVGNGSWVMLQPRTVSAGPITFSDTTPQTIDTVFAITAEPIVAMGGQPPATTNPVPDIEVVPDPTTFQVIADIPIPYVDISRALRNPQTGLVQKTFSYKRRELTVKDAQMYGAGNRVAVELTVTGRTIPANRPKVVDVVTFFDNVYKKLQYAFEKKFYKLSGRIFFTAVPIYSEELQVIGFSDIRLDSASLAVVNKKAKWILRTPMLAELPEGMNLPVDVSLAQLHRRMTDVFNRAVGDRARIESTVDPLRFEGIFIVNSGISTRVKISGQGRLIVDWMSPE